MKTHYTHFTGVDVSKLTLDVCLLSGDDHSSVAHAVFNNNKNGIRQLFKWLKQQAELEHCLFCLEHTGIYAMPLCCQLGEMNLNFALVPAIEVQRSIGLKRGKSDKADALAIAQYALVRQKSISLYQLPERKLMKLRVLLTQRQSLVRHKQQFQLAANEHKGYMEKELMREVSKQNLSLMRSVSAKIKEIEKLIQELVTSDEQMKKTFDLLQSIPGIGPQIAVQLIACTRCFTAFENSRQFACYAGIAPFEYRSGISIKGRNKVSHFANKHIKTLLNLAALNAKKTDRQLLDYAERKLREGKNKMLILNNLRNKIVSRIFATIKRGTPYVHTFNHVA